MPLFTGVRGRIFFLDRLEIPTAPGLKVYGFCHGKRRREARKKVAVVLAIGHTLGAHQALSRPSPDHSSSHPAQPLWLSLAVLYRSDVRCSSILVKNSLTPPLASKVHS